MTQLKQAQELGSCKYCDQKDLECCICHKKVASQHLVHYNYFEGVIRKVAHYCFDDYMNNYEELVKRKQVIIKEVKQP